MALFSDINSDKVYDMLIDKIRATTEPFWFETEGMDFKTVTGELKPNNKTMKYKVTTQLLSNLAINDTVECRNGLCECKGSGHTFPKDVIERNPDWFEPIEVVQEGQYWHIEYDFNEDVIKRIMKVDGSTARHKELSSGREDFCSVDAVTRNARKLSTDEIEQALIKEAKRRGFDKDDIVYYDANWEGELQKELKFEYLEYDRDLDWLTDGWGHVIYKEGNFSEIVDQTPSIEINGYEAEFHEDYVKFGCAKIDRNLICRMADYFSEPFTGNGNKSVNGVKIGEGLFTIEELNEIADYYKKEESGINIGGEPVEVSGIGFSASNMWGNDD